MRAIITTLASLLLAPFLASTAVEIVKPFLPNGWRVLGWMTAMYESAIFPWVVAGAGGLLAGLWLDRIASVFDGRHPMTKRGKLRMLAPSVERISTSCEMAMSPIHEGMVNRNTLRAQIVQTGQKLQKLGIIDPYIPADVSEWVLFHNVSAQWRALLPAMEDGDLATARHLSVVVRENQIKQPVQEPAPGAFWR